MKDYLKRKQKLLAEIKFFEQDYKRNLSQIEEMVEKLSATSFEIQKRWDEIQKQAEKYDEYCYKNNLGEFSNGKN